MSKINYSPINYRTLLSDHLKQKTTSFALGILIFFIVIFSLTQFGLANIKPQRSNFLSKENLLSKLKLSPTDKNIKTYTVKTGDQLFLIAESFYGSALNMIDIMQANNITNPDLIEIGQILIIPSVKPKAPTTGDLTETAAKTDRITLKGEKYIVKIGDSLASIALQTYGDAYAWKKIADANKILDINKLEVGTTLIIPR